MRGYIALMIVTLLLLLCMAVQRDNPPDYVPVTRIEPCALVLTQSGQVCVKG